MKHIIQKEFPFYEKREDLTTEEIEALIHLYKSPLPSKKKINGVDWNLIDFRLRQKEAEIFALKKRTEGLNVRLFHLHKVVAIYVGESKTRVPTKGFQHSTAFLKNQEAEKIM